MALAIAFMVGSMIDAAAEDLSFVVLGPLMHGIAATAIQIIGRSLLSDRFREPKAQAAAFGTFGMVYLFTWLVIPVLRGFVFHAALG